MFGNNPMKVFTFLAMLCCMVGLGHALPSPVCLDPFKSPCGAVRLAGEAGARAAGEFYTEARSVLGQCASVSNKQITREELALQLWLFYYIAETPFIPPTTTRRRRRAFLTIMIMPSNMTCFPSST